MEQNTDKYKSENGKLLETFLRLQGGTVINMSHISAIEPISDVGLVVNPVNFQDMFFIINVANKSYHYTKKVAISALESDLEAEKAIFEQERQGIIEAWKEAILTSR